MKESTQLELRDDVKLRTRDRPTFWPLPDVSNGASPSPPQMVPANESAAAVVPGQVVQGQQDPAQPQAATASPVVVNGA